MLKHGPANSLVRGPFLFALTVAVALLVSPSVSFAAGPFGDETAQGKTLFATNCASCHGQNAAGGLKIGSATSADLRWDKLGKMYHGDVALIRRAVLDGKDEAGADLDPVMPRWRGKLSDAQVNAIIAFLQTTGAPSPAGVPPSTALPTTGEPLGSSNLPVVTLSAGVLALAGLGLRHLLKGTRTDS